MIRIAQNGSTAWSRTQNLLLKYFISREETKRWEAYFVKGFSLTLYSYFEENQKYGAVLYIHEKLN